jgi:hypothetical protein
MATRQYPERLTRNPEVGLTSSTNTGRSRQVGFVDFIRQRALRPNERVKPLLFGIGYFGVNAFPVITARATYRNLLSPRSGFFSTSRLKTGACLPIPR